MAAQNKLHVVVFPWLAFGHITPFLELSKLIAQKGHKISFVSTHKNILRLPKLPPNLSPLISYISLSLPHVDGLPEGAEATMDVSADDVGHLKTAFDGLETEFTNFLQTSSPDWVIYDFAPHWLPPIASKLGISRAYFSILTSWFIASLASSPEDMINGCDSRKNPEDFTVPPDWVTFPTTVAFRLHEIKRLFGSGKDNTSGVTDWYRCGSVILGSDVILFRNCFEFEPDWLGLLEKLHHRPIIPVGLLPPYVQNNNNNSETWCTIKNWLDGQKKCSVVYIALGSEVILSEKEVTELAFGLELSKVPFFWTLRMSVELPNGFVERTKGRGIVWSSWVPQLKILSHECVGGFLTHCGWSSIIEGLMFGHPLITLPFSIDQGLNSRVVVGKKVAVEVPRNEEDGSFTREWVAESVRLVMDEGGGESYRKMAKELSVIFGDKDLHNSYVDSFIGYLETHRSELLTRSTAG